MPVVLGLRLEIPLGLVLALVPEMGDTSRKGGFMKAILTILVVVGALPAIGAVEGDRVVSCQAKVALNRVYDVKIDRETHQASVKTDNGYIYEATCSYTYSPRTHTASYYMPAGFAQGILIQFEQGGANRIALCLKDSECYLCRQ